MLKHERLKWQEIICLGDSADNISFAGRDCYEITIFFFHLHNFMLLSQVAEFSFKPFHEQD